jgi:predicted phage gp36 major capsid-like protein
MSDYTIPTSNTVTTIDPQATKIRELQSDVTQLENRLRALWDKLEGERKYYMERIEKLEEAGDAMAERCEVDIENWYRTKKGEL